VTAIFVTGTGTDIGKTFVAAGLIHHWRAHGKTVEALKPVVTGFDPASAVTSDPGVLLHALGRPGAVKMEEIASIAPWRFHAPLSPDMAARREGRRIDFEELVQFCRDAIEAGRGVLLIEGAGGVMVPLDDSHTVLDWIEALGLPALLVAGSYLGTLSHTLTCLDALARRKIEVAGVVVNESAGSPVPLEETAATVARFAGTAKVIALPRLADGHADHPAFARIAALL
jgi:dethiobiotin synthetase